MLGTTLLLKNKLNNLPKSKRRDYLLNCIEKNKLEYIIKTQQFLKEKEQEKEQEQKEIQSHIFCQLCKNYNFIKDRYSETCQDCGFVRDIVPTQKIFEKIEYIKPGSNLVKITKDSKKITVDLNKINDWLQDTDPLAKDTKKIIDNLNIVFQTKGIELPMIVQNTAISLWYNFNSLYNSQSESHTISLSLKKNYNKKAILALCTYYGASINNYSILLGQLSILFNVNISEIYVTNLLYKEVFKNTEYAKNFVLQSQQYCDIKLSSKNKLIFNKIKEDLIKNFSNISEPLQNKEFAAIIYFITNKVNTCIKYTLKDLENKCNVSTTSISYVNKSIEKFYKNNPGLYKKLLI